MKSMLKGLLLCSVLVVLSGCGVSGKWTMQSIQPDTAKDSFNVQMLCLMDDGTYMMCAQEKGQSEKMHGKYKYDDKENTITFTGDDNKARTYKTELVAYGGEMKLTGGEKGKEWTATMKKEGNCPKGCCATDHKCDATCAERCGMKKDGGKAGTCKMEPAKADTKKEEPKKAEAKKAEPKKAEAKKAEPAKAEPKKDTKDKDKQ